MKKKKQNKTKYKKCCFCSRYFTTANGKAIHEKYAHIYDLCDMNMNIYVILVKWRFRIQKSRNFTNWSGMLYNKCCLCSRYFISACCKLLHEKYEYLCDSSEKMFENAEVKKLYKLEKFWVTMNLDKDRILVYNVQIILLISDIQQESNISI